MDRDASRLVRMCFISLYDLLIPVALSKYVGEGEPLTLIERFVSGYMQTGKLSDAEIECMPDMVSEIWCFPWHDG